jgi:hypothetical protein
MTASRTLAKLSQHAPDQDAAIATYGLDHSVVTVSSINLSVYYFRFLKAIFPFYGLYYKLVPRC